MPHEVWKPIDYADRDRGGLAAVKAVHAGEANPDQQKVAMRFLIERVSGAFDLSYRPESLGGERDTCFSEGRRSVGLEVEKIRILPMELLVGPATKGDA